MNLPYKLRGDRICAMLAGKLIPALQLGEPVPLTSKAFAKMAGVSVISANRYIKRVLADAGVEWECRRQGQGSGWRLIVTKLPGGPCSADAVRSPSAPPQPGQASEHQGDSVVSISE